MPTPTEIRNRIHTLRNLTPTLHDIATKRINLNHTPTNTNPASAPTPLNLAALDMLNQLEALTRLMCACARIKLNARTTVHTQLAMLDNPHICHNLATRSDAAHLQRLLDCALQSASRLTDPTPSSRYIGVCTSCAHGLWIPDSHTTNPTTMCPICHYANPTQTVIQAHQLTLRTSGTTGTAAQLANLLNKCGYHAKRKTIAEWHRRGKLHALNTRNNKPIYALADILNLLNLTNTSVDV